MQTLLLWFLLFQPIQVEVTAYCGCTKCCGNSDGITASGHRIVAGDRFLAADVSVPFGTVYVVPGYNDGRPTKNLDRGGAITKGRIDLYFDSHREAILFGRQKLIIWRERYEK